VRGLARDEHPSHGDRRPPAAKRSAPSALPELQGATPRRSRAGEADINQCPPGGEAGIRGSPACSAGRRSRSTRRTASSALGASPSSTRRAASGARCASRPARWTRSSARQRLMHTVVTQLCSDATCGVAPCRSTASRWYPAGGADAIWGRERADAARERFDRRGARLERERKESAERLARRALTPAARIPARKKARHHRGRDRAGTREARRRAGDAVSPEKRRKLFERLRSANPRPTTELAYRTPFELLVSVVLSAQATDKSVNAATANLYRDANTPQALLALGEAGLTAHIRRSTSRSKRKLETQPPADRAPGGEVPESRRGPGGAAGRRPQDRER